MLLINFIFLKQARWGAVCFWVCLNPVVSPPFPAPLFFFCRGVLDAPSEGASCQARQHGIQRSKGLGQHQDGRKARRRQKAKQHSRTPSRHLVFIHGANTACSKSVLSTVLLHTTTFVAPLVTLVLVPVLLTPAPLAPSIQASPVVQRPSAR